MEAVHLAFRTTKANIGPTHLRPLGHARVARGHKTPGRRPGPGAAGGRPGGRGWHSRELPVGGPRKSSQHQIISRGRARLATGSHTPDQPGHDPRLDRQPTRYVTLGETRPPSTVVAYTV
jgi:hypothetical protein